MGKKKKKKKTPLNAEAVDGSQLAETPAPKTPAAEEKSKETEGSQEEGTVKKKKKKKSLAPKAVETFDASPLPEVPLPKTPAPEDKSEETEGSQEEEGTVKKKKKKKSLAPKVVEAFAESPIVDEIAPKKKDGKNTPFRRVVEEEIIVNDKLADNSFEAKLAAEGDWGEKANNVLKHTKGKSFRHEKTKKKRGSYIGGNINMGVNSIAFESEG